MADEEASTEAHSGELEQLRRIAYSRVGTDDDRRRLAELEKIHRVSTVADTADSEPVEIVETGAAVAPPEPTLLEKRSRITLRHLIGTAIAGLVVGAVIAAAFSMPTGQPSPALSPSPWPVTALAIFDRPATDADNVDNLLIPLDHVLPGGAEGAQLRWLGAVSGSTVYAAKGTLQDITTVCLIVQQQTESGASCAEAGDFAIRGVRLATFGLDFRWGPQGTEMWFVEDPTKAATPNPMNYLSGDRTMGS